MKFGFRLSHVGLLFIFFSLLMPLSVWGWDLPEDYSDRLGNFDDPWSGTKEQSGSQYGEAGVGNDGNGFNGTKENSIGVDPGTSGFDGPSNNGWGGADDDDNGRGWNYADVYEKPSQLPAPTDEELANGYAPGYGYIGPADPDYSIHEAAIAAARTSARSCDGCFDESGNKKRSYYEELNREYFGNLEEAYRSSPSAPGFGDLPTTPNKMFDKYNPDETFPHLNSGKVDPNVVKRNLDEAVKDGTAGLMIGQQAEMLGIIGPNNSATTRFGVRNTHAVYSLRGVRWADIIEAPTGWNGNAPVQGVAMDHTVIIDELAAEESGATYEEVFVHEVTHIGQFSLVAKYFDLTEGSLKDIVDGRPVSEKEKELVQSVIDLYFELEIVKEALNYSGKETEGVKYVSKMSEVQAFMEEGATGKAQYGKRAAEAIGVDLSQGAELAEDVFETERVTQTISNVNALAEMNL